MQHNIQVINPAAQLVESQCRNTTKSQDILENIIKVQCTTYLSFLLVEVVNNNTDEKIEGEEGAENDENDKVNVHVKVDFSDRLFLHLKGKVSQSFTLTCLQQYVSGGSIKTTYSS